LLPKEIIETPRELNMFEKLQNFKLEIKIKEEINNSKNWKNDDDCKPLRNLYLKLALLQPSTPLKTRLNIDHEINDSGWSGLMYSAYHHLDKAVDFFISTKCLISKTNSLGWNAMFLLTMNDKHKQIWNTCCGCFLYKDKKDIFCDNHFRMLRIAHSLKEAGLDYEVKDSVGNTVMVYSLRIKNVILSQWFQYLDQQKMSVRNRKEFMFVWKRHRERKGMDLSQLKFNMAMVVCKYL